MFINFTCFNTTDIYDVTRFLISHLQFEFWLVFAMESVCSFGLNLCTTYV